ncbi:MAG TPA: phosphate acyltransferase, partial [Thermodesulfobacteriota bacterium]|nr:phosphate acyltransferase [Thermodesulfobacteriota bacterium]
MKIAVDAMGGDFAPQMIVEGAVSAAKEYGVKVVLVGDEDQV